ncbi:hypothetical protein JVU11DRAFT_1759 [Chiua virens]|nr:hypothetical protein JVU11DRAFT_1759 [Chiua virens]
MPFNMFKAFSGSRNRTHRDDPSAIYNSFPQGYPPGEPDFPPETTRREPVFTPLPSRTPTDTGDYAESYVRVDSPDAVMRGTLNARPVKMDPGFPPLDGPLSEALSERELAGGLHGTPRLPPQIQRAGSFHSVHGPGDRVNHNEPIIMNSSPTRSSGSDHTIEALHTPPLSHPSDRVIPPLPRSYSGVYGAGSRSPTDIYGSHPYDVVHDSHGHHNGEIYLDRHDRGGSYEKGGPIYYIIPGGMNVIFQDEHGNEITRVGDFSGRTRPLRPGPFVVQDEHGRELYRYDGHDRGTHRGGYTDPQIVQIDAPNNPGYHRRDRSYPSHGYRPDPSYRRGYDSDHYPSHRDHRDHREKDWHDQRDHRYRGYADYPSYNEYRDHRDRGYRDHGSRREYGGHVRDHHDGYRDHYGGYRPHKEYTIEGRPEIQPPNRVSSRASHRSYTHGSQLSIDRVPHQYTGSILDDRRSGRDYAPSHASVQHHEDGVDLNIAGGLEALHI